MNTSFCWTVFFFNLLPWTLVYYTLGRNLQFFPSSFYLLAFTIPLHLNLYNQKISLESTLYPHYTGGFVLRILIYTFLPWLVFFYFCLFYCHFFPLYRSAFFCRLNLLRFIFCFFPNISHHRFKVSFTFYSALSNRPECTHIIIHT